MWLYRPLRKSIHALVLLRAAIVLGAALGVLSARCSTPSLPHLTFGIAASSDTPAHRQLFDHKDSHWGIPFIRTLIIPLPLAAPHPINIGAPPVEFVTDGWHYNRPPPISELSWVSLLADHVFRLCRCERHFSIRVESGRNAPWLKGQQ